MERNNLESILLAVESLERVITIKFNSKDILTEHFIESAFKDIKEKLQNEINNAKIL